MGLECVQKWRRETDLAFLDRNVAGDALFHHFQKHVALELVEKLGGG
jgi:hypothetical protein